MNAFKILSKMDGEEKSIKYPVDSNTKQLDALKQFVSSYNVPLDNVIEISLANPIQADDLAPFALFSDVDRKLTPITVYKGVIGNALPLVGQDQRGFFELNNNETLSSVD